MKLLHALFFLLSILMRFTSANAWNTIPTEIRSGLKKMSCQVQVVHRKRGHHLEASNSRNDGRAVDALPRGRMFAQDSILNTTRKPSSAQGQPSIKSDSSIVSRHKERIQNAGREGSIRFIDPCRVFFGNLDLTATSEDLCEFVANHHGLPATFLIVDAEVITDWKTGNSKGYGFVRYIEPIYATNALETCHGKLWKGRKLSVKPAINSTKQKEVQRQKEMYEQRKLKRELAKVNGEDLKVARRPDALIPTDPRGQAFLRSLDPGLIDDVDKQNKQMNGGESDSIATKNRQQRRKEERSKPKIKPMSKGFGS